MDQQRSDEWGETNLLELEIGALVCNTLVSDTELARGRLALHAAGLDQDWAGRGRRSAPRKRGRQAGCGEGVTLV